MELFEYTAVSAQGKKLSGKISARNKENAIKQLQAKTIFPIEIKSLSAPAASATQIRLPALGKLFKPRVKKAELTEFTRQFGTLVESGIPYHRAIEIITPTDSKTKLTTILNSVKLKVLEGSSLFKALSAHPQIFSKQYLAAVLAGEKTGKLGLNMLQQAEFLDTELELKNKVQAALIYPAIMLVLGIGILIFMIEYILPKIVPIFAFFDHALPLPTRILIGLSDIIANYNLILLLALIGILIGVRAYLNNPTGKQNFEKWMLKLPVIGPLQTQLQLLKFSLSLSALLQSGITIKEALTIAGNATGNSVFSSKIKHVQELTVSKGYTLSKALKSSQFFDEKYVQIVNVGEESGKLETMLLKYTKNLKLETQAKLQQLVAFLEPVIILVMAVMVGMIVLSILLPIFELNLLIQ